MRPYLESVVNVLLDRSPEEWIEGIVVALFLSLALAGAYGVCRRWMKATDDTIPLVVPAMVVILAGMVITAGYVQLKLKAPARPTDPASRFDMRRPQGPPFRGREFMAVRMGNLIFEAADADGDGRLSPDEAVNAAAKFVEDADVNGEGTLDRDALITALRDRLRPPDGAPQPTVGPAPESRPPSRDQR
jgi:hypothetical protein